MTREEIADALIGIQEDLPSEEDRAVLGFAAHYLRHAQGRLEPVAWRWRTLPKFSEDAADQEWELTPTAPSFINPHHHEVEPLYTSASAQGAPREALVSVTASLAAAISLLERMPKAKKAAPSDKMFEQMLVDYRKSLETGRAATSTDGCPK